MSKIPEHSIEDVRSRIDIVDVVSEYVQLKKRGNAFWGLCPFHNEKSPSFSVNTSLDIFKCFGCGEGGDVFSFISRVENLSFPESVRLLAEKAGVVLPEDDAPDGEASMTESIHHALRFAARFFHESLAHDEEAKPARDYLRERGFSEDIIKTFGLGYAPAAWDGLLTEASRRNISEEVLEQAGLIIPRKKGEGYYDRYRHRLIFPIMSHVGKVLGFGGRVLRSEDEPKYINSPETAVYNKRRVLYGLYHGKNAIRGKEEAILVEGYTDVVSLFQAGVEHVVASSGTALTEEQVALLGRYAKTIVLLYDADSAGLRAALKAIDLVLAAGLAPYAVQLPEGEDPDSFVREHGGEAFVTYLKEHRQNFIDFVLAGAEQAGRLNTPEGTAAVQRTVLQSIAKIPDPLVRESYLRTAASILDLPDVQLRPIVEEMLRKNRRGQARSQASPGRRSMQVSEAPKRGPGPVGEAEKNLLRLMLEKGIPMVEWVMGRMALSEFTEGAARDMAQALVAQYEAGRVDRRPFLENAHGDDVRKLAAEVLTRAYEPSDNWKKKKNIPVPPLNENAREAATLAMVQVKLKAVDARIAQERERLRQAEEAGDDPVQIKRTLLQLDKVRRAVQERTFVESD